jgi:hypothetical protein
MAVPFLAVELATEELRDQLREAADRVVRSGWYVLGPEVDHFEAAFADYLGVRHCIGVGNGFDALHPAFRALGIGRGMKLSSLATPTSRPGKRSATLALRRSRLTRTHKRLSSSPTASRQRSPVVPRRSSQCTYMVIRQI